MLERTGVEVGVMWLWELGDVPCPELCGHQQLVFLLGSVDAAFLQPRLLAWEDDLHSLH